MRFPTMLICAASLPALAACGSADQADEAAELNMNGTMMNDSNAADTNAAGEMNMSGDANLTMGATPNDPAITSTRQGTSSNGQMTTAGGTVTTGLNDGGAGASNARSGTAGGAGGSTSGR